jgi:hypothetical protein
MRKLHANALRLAIPILVACASPTPTHAESPPTVTSAAEARDGQHDFDFMFGTFNIKIRRLRHPLQGSSDWYEMNGTTTCRPILGGTGNIEEGVLDGPDGRLLGVMVRLYSPKSREWSLNWTVDGRGRFDVPTVGRFKDGRGEFYDQEVFEGRTILVRYVWSDTTTSTPHFEQSFSADGGKTWELNWASWSTRAR